MNQLNLIAVPNGAFTLEEALQLFYDKIVVKYPELTY